MPLKSFRRLTSRRRDPPGIPSGIPSGMNAPKPHRGRLPRRPQPRDPSASTPRAPAWRDESPCGSSLYTDSVDSCCPLSSMSANTSTSSSTSTSSGRSTSEHHPGRLAHPRRSPTSSFGFIKSAPTVNVYTTCGRHTDQLLFGGPSLSGFARAFLKPALRDS